MHVRIKNGAQMNALYVVLCVVALLLECFVGKAIKTAQSAADAFMQENAVSWGVLRLEAPFQRTYTLFTIDKRDSYCSLFDGDVVEATTSGWDINGKIYSIDACFNGLWWEKKIPTVYTIDPDSLHQQ